VGETPVQAGGGTTVVHGDRSDAISDSVRAGILAVLDDRTLGWRAALKKIEMLLSVKAIATESTRRNVARPSEITVLREQVADLKRQLAGTSRGGVNPSGRTMESAAEFFHSVCGRRPRVRA